MNEHFITWLSEKTSSVLLTEKKMENKRNLMRNYMMSFP